MSGLGENLLDLVQVRTERMPKMVFRSTFLPPAQSMKISNSRLSKGTWCWWDDS